MSVFMLPSANCGLRASGDVAAKVEKVMQMQSVSTADGTKISPAASTREAGLDVSQAFSESCRNNLRS
jgi:hypothetical protein